MAKPKSGNFDQNKYKAGFIHENYKWVNIPFRNSNQEDMEIYEYLKTFERGAKAPYIKMLIKRDMELIQIPKRDIVNEF